MRAFEKAGRWPLKLPAVRKAGEIDLFLLLGRFETEGSNLRYGIPKGVATVRPHLRKVSI